MDSTLRQKLVLLAVCGFFIAVGLAIFIPTFLLPVRDFLAMREWTETPCTILRGPAGDGDLRTADVAFTYTLDHVRYESKRVGLEGMFVPMRPVWDLKPGAAALCYVDPRDRRQAVLYRDLDPTILAGLAPLLFVILPGFALVAGWSSIGRPVPPPPPPVPEGPAPPSLLLQPAMRRRGCAILMTAAFIVIFGTIVAVLWIFGTIGHRVLAVPFALAWLFLLRLLGRLLLSTLNPRVAIRVTPGRGVAGGAIDVRWDVVGGLRDIRRFVLELEAREELVWRSGKNATIRKSPLAALVVARGGPKELRKGSARISLPATMHSFRNGPVSVVWVFHLTAEIPLAPDIDEEYALEVAPS